MWMILIALLIPLLLIGLLLVTERLESSTWLEKKARVVLLAVAVSEFAAAAILYLDQEGLSWMVIAPLVAGFLAIAETIRRSL